MEIEHEDDYREGGLFEADVILIDARNLLFRNTDANAGLSWTIDGEEFPTGGMYGFMVSILKLLHDYPGAVPHVCWEGTRNFRFDLYPEYKAKRKSSSRENDRLPAGYSLGQAVNAQTGPTREILSALGIQQWWCSEGEADDAIGALAQTFGEDHGDNVLIFSGDGDLRQLVRENVVVLSPGRMGKESKLWDVDAVKERYGVSHPRYVADYKALVGDSSDNIPGVKGVGKVAAKKLFARWESLSEILAGSRGDSSDWPHTKSSKEKINAARNLAIKFHAVTRIRTDLKLSQEIGQASEEEAKTLLAKYGCRSLMGSAVERLLQ